MEPASWGALTLNGRITPSSYMRPFADKPSFDELSRSSLEAAHTSFLAADRIAAEWERVESLFERSWFGPCSCFTGVWGSSSRVSELDDSLHGIPSVAALSTADIPPPPAPNTFLRNSYLQAAEPVPPPHRGHVSGNGAGPASTPVLYGASGAPIPEPSFPANGQSDAPPLRPVPVRRRQASDTGDDGCLPAALPIEPPLAAVTEPVPTAASPYAPGPADVATPLESEPMPLGPQLGTWADRQYRLLDAVPERGENGMSVSASVHNSVHDSSSINAAAQRSADIAVARSSNSNRSRTGGGGGGARSGSGPDSAGGETSGACASGSGEYSAGGRSSSNAPGASPSLLDVLSKPDPHCGAGSSYLDGEDLEGRRRAGSELLALKALQAQQQLQQQQENGHHLQDSHQQCQQPQQQPEQQQQQRPLSAFADMGSAEVQAAAEAMMQEAAWRWRFTRRWQAEQARTGAEQASSAPKDQMEEALAYLQATNATTSVSMQIANTSVGGAAAGGRRCNHGGGGGAAGAMSMEGSLALQSLMGTLGAANSTLGGEMLLAGCGSGSGSFTSGSKILRQASGEMLAASREVASLNRRAAVVLQQQLDCEQQAERRVQESLGQGPPWVGQFIPIVQIDEWGSFRFLMLKLRDQTARGPGNTERQRILIRGHNYGSEGQLMEECNRDILAQSQKHNVPFEAPTVMGGGVMEWRRDRDRHLHLHSGFVMDRVLPLQLAGGGGLGLEGLGGGGGGLLGGAGGAAAVNGGRPASAMDLLNLAAALARQSFPSTYKITVLT